jgi:superfamily II DNA/RNA helicase
MISTIKTWMGDVARMEEKGSANQFVAEIIREIDHLKDLDKDFKIILKWIHEI